MSEATRCCKVCQAERPLSQFREYVKNGKSYWLYTCIDCENERRRQRYLESIGGLESREHRTADMSDEAVWRRKWSRNNIRKHPDGRWKFYWED